MKRICEDLQILASTAILYILLESLGMSWKMWTVFGLAWIMVILEAIQGDINNDSKKEKKT